MKIEVYRNGELFFSHPLPPMPEGFGEERHNQRKAIIDAHMSVVKSNLKKVIGSLHNVTFFLSAPSSQKTPVETGVAIKTNCL